MTGPHLILGIGELLWDCLPEGKRLGGAPANFAVMAARLGSQTVVLSRLGRDELGRELMDGLRAMPTELGHIQIDSEKPTGTVGVEIVNGQPHYTIHQPVAWDFMELTDEWMQLAERADAICFGSLAQRNDQSRRTIQQLVASTSAECIRIFDVNLRKPFFMGDVIEESLGLASVMKMNDDEVPLVIELLGLDPAPASAKDPLLWGAEKLLEEFENLDLVAITRGGSGSLLVRRDEWHSHPGHKITVSDTIGAGDAFTAAMTHYLLKGADLATLNEAGNRWGSWIASQSGAMPELPDALKQQITQAIDDIV